MSTSIKVIGFASIAVRSLPLKQQKHSTAPTNAIAGLTSKRQNSFKVERSNIDTSRKRTEPIDVLTRIPQHGEVTTCRNNKRTIYRLIQQGRCHGLR